MSDASTPPPGSTLNLGGGDRTVIDSGPVIGGDGGATLPLGHRLQEYVIEGLIGEGGFGIVYLARDTQLGRVVALKEYMPSSLATRGANHDVSVRSARHRETFELGLRSFVNEAQLLASFDHPALVKVYRFWEQHGTAYMVMPFYQGPTLKQWLQEKGTPGEAWLLSLLHPLIDALEVMHHQHCYHRDIAPDNILLLSQQSTQLGAPQALRPVLLDFGAARRVIGDATQALTVILKSGYAPIEQYAESSSMKQGAWTDVYALCAVLYAAITGRAPLPSVSRMVTDDMEPAAKAGAGRYSPQFLAAVDVGLSVRPEQRPQDMAALRVLFAGAAAPAPDTAPSHSKLESGSVSSRDSDDDRTRIVARPPPPASHAAAWTAGAVATLALAGAAWWFTTRPAPVAVAAAPASAAAASVPVVAVIAAPAVPFGIVTALQDIVRHADPLLGVNALADKSVLTIGRDRLQFRVKASESGYVYIFLAGTDKSHLYLLFPNQIDKNNHIDANQEMLLPRTGWHITAGGPPGTNHIVAVVSRKPRDFGAAGLRHAGDEIPEFDLAQAEQLWARRAAGENPLAGKATCETGAACDAAYGATLLAIDEVAAK